MKSIRYCYDMASRGGKMPNIKSKAKRMRQAEKRRLRNKAVKTRVKNVIKEFKEALEAGRIEEASAQLPLVYKTLDKAASKGVIHKRRAAAFKSELTKKLNQLSLETSKS